MRWAAGGAESPIGKPEKRRGRKQDDVGQSQEVQKKEQENRKWVRRLCLCEEGYVRLYSHGKQLISHVTSMFAMSKLIQNEFFHVAWSP